MNPCPRCGGTEFDRCNQCRACFRATMQERNARQAKDPKWLAANAAALRRTMADPRRSVDGEPILDAPAEEARIARLQQIEREL